MNKKFLFMAACCCGCQALNAAVVPYLIPVPGAAFPRSAYNNTPLSVPYGSRINIDDLTVEGTVVVTDGDLNEFGTIRRYHNAPYWNKAYCELDIYRPMAFNLPDGLQLTYSLRQILDLYKTPQAFTTFFSQLAFKTASQVIAVCHWLRSAEKESLLSDQNRRSPRKNYIDFILLKGPDLNETDQLLLQEGKLQAAKQSTLLVRDIDRPFNFSNPFYSEDDIYCNDYLTLFKNFSEEAPTLDVKARANLIAKIIRDFSLDQAHSYLGHSIDQLRTSLQNGYESADRDSKWLPLCEKASILLEKIKNEESEHQLVIVPYFTDDSVARQDYYGCIRSHSIDNLVENNGFPASLTIQSQKIKVMTPVPPIQSRLFGRSAEYYMGHSLEGCFVVIAQGEPEPIKVDQPNNDNQ